MASALEAWVAGVLAAQPRAIARAISALEDGDEVAFALLSHLYPAAGKAMTIGVTGPPGAGKSTLVDRLAGVIQSSGRHVAVIAVDPASPFTGGAILGDRVRMAGVGGADGVFVRSMSTRGHLGGIAVATEGAATVLDAAGFEVIIIETVGVGQSEIEVAQLADTTVLVQPPHLGDGVQAVKAGIMEVPQVFVINKADLPGAKQAAAEINAYLDLGGWQTGTFRPPVCLATATANDENGADGLWAAIQAHWAWGAQAGRLQAGREARMRKLVWQEAERAVVRRLHALATGEAAEAVLRAVAAREQTPAAGAATLVYAVWPETP